MDAKSLSLRKKFLPSGAVTAALAAALACGLAHAASTDISTQPLANAAAVAAKPNIMFILDNSGSMADANMPDDMSDTGKYGYKSIQCNGVAFDPTQTYSAPLKADGTSYPDVNFLAAPSDGYTNVGSNTNSSSTSLAVATGSVTVTVPGASGGDYSVGNAVTIVSTTDPLVWLSGNVTAWTSSGTKTLTVNVTGTSGSGTFSSWTVGVVTNLDGKTYYAYTGSEKPMDWTYTASGVITSTNFYKECMSNIGSTPGSSKFTLTTVNSASAAALKQKYANWFSYYHTRRLMMRTATGRAFSGLNSNFRVGFTTISDTGATQGTNKFVDIGDFDATKKAAFYASLYSATGSSNTPLRGALSKVGRYFANKAPGQTSDPMQYSCQRNYAILSTDGYWNTGSETSSYTALDVSGNSIGQQDNAEDKPMWDGATTTVTATTPTNTVQHKKTTTGSTTTTNVWTRYVWTIPSNPNNCGGTSGRYTVTIQPQTRTEVIGITSTDTLTDVTTTTTHTTVTVNGTISSQSDSAPTQTTATVGTTTNASSDLFSGWVNGTATTACASTTGMGNAGIAAGNSYNSSTTATICTGSGGCNFNAAANGAVTSSNTPAPAGSPSTVILGTDGPTVGATTTSTNTTGGSTNSLADIAEYYYKTDLRNSSLSNCTGALGTNICNDTLKPLDRDTAASQHMTTYTIGLGVSGTLTYDPNYLTQTTGSYVQLTNGTVNWPVPTASSNGGDATNVDDLWHAAVNGRGRYFATTNATSLSNALSSALAAAFKVVGAAAGASTNSLKPVAGDDNRAYIATYTTVEWTGDLSAYPLDATNGTINTLPAARVWSAQAVLDAKVLSSRVIKYKAPGSATLKDFTFTNLTADGYGSYFSGFCSQATVPAQCASLTATQVTTANTGGNLVSFLRGDDTYEAATNLANPLYRERTHRLGDIVNGSPVYVKAPPFSYADAGYSSFVTAQSSRTAMLYAPSNDGMLHAFTASNGDEAWAYVPSFVMSKMYKLADTAYGTNHQYLVDGTPVVGDIKVGSTWKTILVGGLNSGGRGYYALDITNPSAPAVLWEFTDANMGMTYGNPIITKRTDGTWVVAVTSGYNNTSGDGQGHLYVLNANTGALVSGGDLSTATGSSGSPSGLGKINAWVDSETDNTVKRFYGADLLGNVWRFDTEDLIAPAGKEATLLASLMVGSTTPQSITVAPQLALVRYAGNDYPVVFVATGKYLGNTDVSDTTQQTIYGIKDTLAASGWGDFRARSDVVSQTVTVGTTTSTVTSNAVDWSAKAGWRLDLPQSKERVVTEMQLQFTNLVAASAIPGGTECDPAGGSSWLYQVDVATGGASDSSGTLSTFLGNFLTVGLTWFQTTGGDNKGVHVGSDGSAGTDNLNNGKGGAGTPHRTSWRELVNN